MTGGRHPFLSKFKIGFNNDGQITAANIDLYSNAGWSVDLSLAVLQRAVMNCENSYFIPFWRSSGRCCRTNLASNTAFRGFGAMQGMRNLTNNPMITLRLLNLNYSALPFLSFVEGQCNFISPKPDHAIVVEALETVISRK